MTKSWSYPSIVGMLLYLSSNTRPDVCFAVSQVARFTHSPKQSHAKAVKSIVRYLSGTSPEGTLISLPSSYGLSYFTDSDFAGLFKRDPDDSPSSAKSRSGYLIKFCDCPLLWKSHLQPTIALSTAEAEYYSLSQAMRSLLPIRSTLKEFLSIVHAPVHYESLSKDIPTTVYVDNTSALTLAREQQITSRTRHSHCMFHFFWNHVRPGGTASSPNRKSSAISVAHVTTKFQVGDYFTKSLDRKEFQTNHLRVQGW